MNRINNNTSSASQRAPKDRTNITVSVPTSAAPKSAPRPRLQRPVRPHGPPRALSGPQKAYASVRATVPKSPKAPQTAVRLLSSLVLPRETESVRLSSNYGGDKTAIAKLFRKTNIDPIEAVTGAGDIPRTNCASFAFRDPLRSFVHSIGTSATDQYSYQANAEITSSEQRTTYPEFESPLDLDTAYSNIDPHGGSLFLGRLGPSDPYRGIFASTGDTLTIVVAARPGAINNYKFTVSRVVGSQWVILDNVALIVPQSAGGVAAYAVTSPGYYAISMYTEGNSGLPSLGIGLIIKVGRAPAASTYMCWGHLALPHIRENLKGVKAYRITSVSLMYTNTASPLNRQGQITGLQLPKRSIWIDHLDYEELSSSNKAFTLNVVNGLYGFLKPTSPSDFEMDSFQFSTDLFDDEYVFDILPKSDYLAIQSSIETDAGRQGYLTPAHHIEFETLSQWFSTDNARGSPSDLDFALRSLSLMAQWHENDFHLSDIWEGIKSAASGLWKGIKEVGNAVAPYAPLAMALI